MTTSAIIAYRLANQQIAETSYTKPEEIVKWFGAMQAQEFGLAKWAIGLRLPGSTDKEIETAFNNGVILRTHILRPTWHFVTPADIRWILALTAPRIKTFSASLYKKLELDQNTFKRSNDVFAKIIEGKQVNRNVLKQALERKKINTAGLRFVCLLMHAELDGIICSGPRINKQFTYALLEERVPAATALTKEEALAALAERYFISRSPATIQDFVWWSGLTVKEAKAGIAALGKNFIQKQFNGREYIFLPLDLISNRKLQTTFLLPDYDEYGISYKNRQAIFTASNNKPVGREEPAYKHMLVIGGIIGGTWKKTAGKNGITVQTQPYKKLSKAKQKVLAQAERKYLAFVNA